MQNAALLWHVSLLARPDKKGLALGFVGLARVAPVVFFSMVSGVVADAMDRRRRDAGHADRCRRWSRWRWRCSPSAAWRRCGTSTLLAALERGGERVRSAVAPGAAADAGAARASAQRDQPEHDHVPDRVGARPGARRPADCGDQRRLDLRQQRGFVRVRDRRAADDARCPGPREPSEARRATTCRCSAAHGRAAVRVPLAAHPIDDAARFLRDVLRLGDGAAADLRAGHPAGRPARLRLAVCRAGDRRRSSPAWRWCRWSTHIKRRGASIIWSVAGHGAATVVFGLSRSFWLTFALPGAGRRHRHGQHRAPQHDPEPRDARSPARPDDRHQHGVLHGRPAARRARGRRAWRTGSARPFSVITGGIGCLLATAWVAATAPDLRRYREAPPVEPVP